MAKLNVELTPETVSDLLGEFGLSASSVFGKESGDRVKFSKAINDPDKNSEKYSDAETAYILDAIGLDPMQVIEFSDNHLFNMEDGNFQKPKIRLPRREIKPIGLVNLLRAGVLPRQVSARYIPAKDEHKENMLEATRILTDAKSAIRNDSFECMQREFALKKHLEGCTVDVAAYNAEQEFLMRESGEFHQPSGFFDAFDPAYGPENAFREGIEIFAHTFYYIVIRQHDSGEGIYYAPSEWRAGFDIEFDTIFFDDRSWRRNSRETEVFLVDGDTGEPADFEISTAYEGASRERLIDSVREGRPDKVRHDFGATELFQHGLMKARNYRSEGS